MLDWTQWFQGFAHIFTGWSIGALLIAAGAAAWFKLPVVGKYAGCLAISAGCALIWGAVQYDAAAGNCKEAIVRAQLSSSQARVAELERQMAASRGIAAMAQLREIDARTAAEAANKKAQDYEDKLSQAGKNGACVLDDDLWNRLRP